MNTHSSFAGSQKTINQYTVKNLLEHLVFNRTIVINIINKIIYEIYITADMSNFQSES